MGFFRVREGQSFGQNGKDIAAGSVVELDDRMAEELRSKVDPSDEHGNLIEREQEVVRGLATAQPHERVSLLEMEAERLRRELAAIEKQIEDEKAREKSGPHDEKKSSGAQDGDAARREQKPAAKETKPKSASVGETDTASGTGALHDGPVGSSGPPTAGAGPEASAKKK